MENYSQSFSPLIGKAPKTLILGTLPSTTSLQKHEYYGHPRNHFWKILFAICEQDFKHDYSDRIALVRNHSIAIWDICHKAQRPGSLDSNISDEIPNDIESLLKQYSTISTICFNGKKAEQLYLKHFKKKENITYHTLLSTSPANASYSFEQKLENWQQCVDVRG